MTVGRICIREVDLATPEETVQVAANRMNARNVGTLVVLDRESHPIGILTDRDLAVRVVGQGLNVFETLVADVSSPAPDTVFEDASIESALAQMRAKAIRRLPVVDVDGKLVGLVSLDDILELLCEEFEDIGKLVRREGPMSLA